jgi:hypothetical protein
MNQKNPKMARHSSSLTGGGTGSAYGANLDTPYSLLIAREHLDQRLMQSIDT